MNEFVAPDDKVIVKIFDADKELKNTSKEGIITTHMLKPTLDYCQIGIAVSVGDNLKYIKQGEMVLFSWIVEDTQESLIDKDDNGEYRYVTERQIYGTIKTTKGGFNHIQPKRSYVISQPDDRDFSLTKSIFQIPILSVNPQDHWARKMKLKSGDWIIVLPNCAVPITIKRVVFWMICLEDIVCVNRGEHRISINRKYSSQHLRLSSRKVKTDLN